MRDAIADRVTPRDSPSHVQHHPPRPTLLSLLQSVPPDPEWRRARGVGDRQVSANHRQSTAPVETALMARRAEGPARIPREPPPHLQLHRKR